MREFPYEIGDIISTPDLIGGVTGILVEVERLKETVQHDEYSYLSVMRSLSDDTARSDARTHRIKLAIVHSNSTAFSPGDVCDFWPPQGATWKKW